MNAKDLVAKLNWLGHDSFRLDGPPIIYFDPWRLKDDLPVADLVLVSHEHSDHCSPDDIDKISGPETVVVCNAGSAAQLPGARTVSPGDHLAAAGVEIEAVRAYNINKFRSPGVPFHPKEANHVGYIVTVDGVRIYHTGDTDHIPEMSAFDCDIALLPVSGQYVMTAEEAVEAAQSIKPQIVVPMHYGAGIGTADDGARFSGLYGGKTVLLDVV
jgi:L-ascorbate metabolism protein UlaG (beta-lactamase superfamily)